MLYYLGTPGKTGYFGNIVTGKSWMLEGNIGVFSPFSYEGKFWSWSEIFQGNLAFFPGGLFGNLFEREKYSKIKRSIGSPCLYFQCSCIKYSKLLVCDFF